MKAFKNLSLTTEPLKYNPFEPDDLFLEKERKVLVILAEICKNFNSGQSYSFYLCSSNIYVRIYKFVYQELGVRFEFNLCFNNLYFNNNIAQKSYCFNDDGIIFGVKYHDGRFTPAYVDLINMIEIEDN